MIRLLAAALRHTSALTQFAILGLIIAIYWPAIYAGFVWDDNIFIHDSAWVTKDNHWISIVLHGFPDWKDYFRPLGVALLALEARAFDLAPMPMHLLSLGIHLANVLLVGLLAKRLLALHGEGTESTMLVPLAMLMFGLHPALIEPAAWISAQFELLVTFFTLFGLLLNLRVQRLAIRATAVAMCFFLAACSKESALCFPPLMFIMDWQRVTFQPDPQTRNLGERFRLLVHRQWPVYLAVLTAGLAYLALRGWGLGSIVNLNFKSNTGGLAQLQTVCFTYLAYWKLLIWPMSGLAPIHIIAGDSFAQVRPQLLATDIGAVLILLGGLWLLFRHRLTGYIIIAVTAALLPVLHIIPLRFDESLYHERYAMIAIAVACALIPVSAADFARAGRLSAWGGRAGALLAIVWLLLAAANIRVTLPLWSDDVRLWEWALRKNPEAIAAQAPLFEAFIRRNDITRARPLAETIMQNGGSSCAACMLSIAGMHLSLGDEQNAASALRQARNRLDAQRPTPSQTLSYMLLSGALAELRRDNATAEAAYRSAVAFEPLDPNAHLGLATLLAREGKFGEARTEAESAFQLYAPDQRAPRKSQFEQVLAASIAASRKP